MKLIFEGYEKDLKKNEEQEVPSKLVYEGQEQPKKGKFSDYLGKAGSEFIGPYLSAAASSPGQIADIYDLLHQGSNWLSGEAPPERLLGPHVGQEALKEKYTDPLMHTLFGEPEDVQGNAYKYATRLGNAAPSYAAGLPGVAAGILGPTAEQATEMLGGGPALQTVAGLAVPNIKTIYNAGKKLLGKGAAKTFEKSGLTKPAAVESKHAEKAVISAGRKEKTLKKIEDEAEKIAKGELHKRHPIIKDIEAGVDFQGRFDEKFGELSKYAKDNNFVINTRPIDEAREKARTLGKKERWLGESNSKIKEHLRRYGDQPVQDFEDAYATYRKNNELYKESLSNEHLKEYRNYLTKQNEAIVKSFEDSILKDDKFLKVFKEENAIYKAYQDASAANIAVSKALKGPITPKTLIEFPTNKGAAKKLEKLMGKESADKIIALSQDMKEAKNAINNIPVKELSAWQQFLPIAFFTAKTIPGASAAGLKWLGSKSKVIYGHILTNPELQKDYRGALKALKEGNKAAYIEATRRLSKEFEEE